MFENILPKIIIHVIVCIWRKKLLWNPAVYMLCTHVLSDPETENKTTKPKQKQTHHSPFSSRKKQKHIFFLGGNNLS